MKFFYKFLILVLILSLTPLILYTFILLNTTAVTTKEIIDENNINLVNNIANEVNNFFIELDAKLNIARQFERMGKINEAEKIRMLLTEFSKDKMLYGFSLLDKDLKVITGLTFDETSSDIDKDLIEKSNKTEKIVLGNITQSSQNKPYFDIVYRIDTNPKEYLYLRVNIKYLLEKIEQYLKIKNAKFLKNISLIDEFGNVVSVLDTQPYTIDKKQLTEYQKKAINADFTTISEAKKVFIKDNRVNIIMLSKVKSEWLILFQEPIYSAYAPIFKMKLTALMLIVSTSIFAFFAVFKLVRDFTKPIQKIISGIEIVAEGNLDHKISGISHDELGKVASAFNSMTLKLKKLQEDIRKSERLATIGQMANIVGHEIRNPLAAISNAAYLIKMQVLKMTEKNPKILRYVEIIENEINSSNKIINDMLSYSRSREPVLSKRNINEVISNIIEDTVIPQNIQLQLMLKPEIPEVAIDVEEIKQVIRNLVNNAIDSMEKKETGILKLTTSFDKTSNSVCVEISDTGCGIPPENLEKIFEPFFSTKSKGTGLGLSVVKRIIEERHKGKIEVKSIVGQGTTFYVKLPVQ